MRRLAGEQREQDDRGQRAGDERAEQQRLRRAAKAMAMPGNTVCCTPR